MSGKPPTKPIKPVMPPGRKWKWADGLMHDTAPPDGDDLVIPAEPGWTPPEPATAADKAVPAPAPALPPVPDGFVFDDRARLRVQALDFAIRGGQAVGLNLKSGAALLAEAELIERWLAGGKSLSGKEP